MAASRTYTARSSGITLTLALSHRGRGDKTLRSYFESLSTSGPAPPNTGNAEVTP